MAIRRLLGALLLVLAGVLPAHAEVLPCPPTGLRAVAHEVIQVGAVAVGFTPAQLTRNVVAAYVSTETDTIRYWEDGTTPTATVGHALVAGTSFYVCGSAMVKFLAISKNGGAVPTHVTFYER